VQGILEPAFESPSDDEVVSGVAGWSKKFA